MTLSSTNDVLICGGRFEQGMALMGSPDGLNLVAYDNPPSVHPIDTPLPSLLTLQNNSLLVEHNSCVSQRCDNISKLNQMTMEAIRAIYYSQLKKLGAIVDEIFRSQFTEKDVNRLYLAARIYGAYGGMPDGNRILFIVPSHKRPMVLDELSEKGVREIPFVVSGKQSEWGISECGTAESINR